MPVEPRLPAWLLPDPGGLPAGRELVAVGAELSAGILLAGYRKGLFPMPDGHVLGWWSPDPRGILRPGQVHVTRSLRRSLGRFTVTVDRAFDVVLAGCADPARPHGWISVEYVAAYRELHALGWAHSVEVWDADVLAGGLFGVEVGGLFSAESKFHVARDASKVALVALADLLAADQRPERIVDVQWRTPHLASLGVVEVPRRSYLDLLAAALALPPALGGAADAGGAAPPRPASPQPEAAATPPSRIRWR